jgi:hypothetical protein
MAVTEQTAVSSEDVLAQTLRRDDTFVTVTGTLKERYRLGEVKADFIKGLVYLYTAVSTPHERIFMRTANKLYNFAEAQFLGAVLGSRTPVDFGFGYHRPTFSSSPRITRPRWNPTALWACPTW